MLDDIDDVEMSGGACGCDDAGGATSFPTAVTARPKNRCSARIECTHTLFLYLKKFGRLDADGVKRISDTTARERGQFLKRCIHDLCRVPDAQGKVYKIRNIKNFGLRHVAHLVWIWEQRGYSASAIQKYLSFLRTLATWIGKKGMIGDASDYLTDPARAKRIRIATSDKGWEAKGIDVDLKLPCMAQDSI